MKFILFITLMIIPCSGFANGSDGQNNFIKIAQASKVKKKTKTKSLKTKAKKRRVKGSSRYKTKIDFSNLDIDAGVKSGLELYIDNIKAKRDYDNIQIRTKWTKEMIHSALSLETGRGNR